MFEVVGQDIISGNMGFIGTDSDRLYRMGTAEKTEDITVTGNCHGKTVQGFTHLRQERADDNHRGAAV